MEVRVGVEKNYWGLMLLPRPGILRSTFVGRNTQKTRKITNTLFRGREIQYHHFQPVISDQKSSKRSSIDGTKMVWMRLMDKTNMRRKQSKSPTSSDGLPKIKNGILFGAKHKRRILRKRDSTAITEASSLGSRGWSVDTDNALWRVENIRESPPAADEWWEDVGAPETIDVYHGSDDDKSDSGERVVTHISSCNQKFHNCGYETWVRARQEWKQQTVDVVPERPQLLERSQITKGLRKNMSQRTYELPRNVALPDLINMYQDIWDSSH